MSVTATPLAPNLGVAITGISASELVDRAAADACLTALEQHGVAIYPQIDVSDNELVTFSHLLGDVVPNRTCEHELREIATITLDPTKTNAMLASYRQGNFLWHIDGMTDELPQRATLLTAREVDEAGGDTAFATTYAAYEALSDSERARIADLRVVHSFAAAQRGTHPDASAEEKAAWARVPSRVHPLVWRRRDGRRSTNAYATTSSQSGVTLIRIAADRESDASPRLRTLAERRQLRGGG
jgi:alpha-ketoglutarate-dependent taurine dioxygenase